MSTYFKDIRAAIKKVIDDQVNTKQVVYNYERSTFAGFPAIVVAPSENEADYASSQKDRLAFVFKIRAYYEIAGEDSHSAAETNLEAVLDELLTVFKSREVLGVACDWVEPIPGTWYYEERGEGLYRVVEMTLKCVKYVSN